MPLSFKGLSKSPKEKSAQEDLAWRIRLKIISK
jgi:hypothetical protein